MQSATLFDKCECKYYYVIVYANVWILEFIGFWGFCETERWTTHKLGGGHSRMATASSLVAERTVQESAVKDRPVQSFFGF